MNIINKTVVTSAVAGIVSLGLGLGVAYAKPPRKAADPERQQQRQAKHAEFKQACGQDAKDLCAGVQGGKGAVLQCLAEHEEELSDACAAKVGPLKAKHAEREKVKAACQADVQQLCGGVEQGKGAVKQCLKANRDKLSEGCKGAIKAAKGDKQGKSA